MLMKPCARCGDLVVYPTRHCDKCAGVVADEQEVGTRLANKRYNERRDPKYAKFYKSRAWGTLSQTYMQHAQYKCEDCGEVASEVHHIKPIQTDEGWVKRLDWTNLRAQCLDCHNLKHKRFQKRSKPKRN